MGITEMARVREMISEGISLRQNIRKPFKPVPMKPVQMWRNVPGITGDEKSRPHLWAKTQR